MLTENEMKKIMIFLLLIVPLFAEVVKMDDGKCYEKKGKIFYIAPCPKIEEKTENTMTASAADNVPKESEEEMCRFTVGPYRLVYAEYPLKKKMDISCDDALQNIKAMVLGYDESLRKRKSKIADLTIRNGVSKCRIGLFYGEYLMVGIMSGDKPLCNDFMVYHSRVGHGIR